MPSGPTRSSLHRLSRSTHPTRLSAMRALAVLTLALLAGACGTESSPIEPAPEPPGDGPNPPGLPIPLPPGTAVNERIAFTSTRDGEPFIYLATPDGSAIRRLTRGEWPAWSPDGRRIAFARRGGENGFHQIRVINADGTHERIVAEHGLSPSWSPDGQRIVFSSGVGMGGGIFAVNADGTGLTLLLSHLFRDSTGMDWLGMPSWSPDGKAIAFISATYETGRRLFVMNADGSAPREIASTAAYGDPSWSPDGTRIAVGDFVTVATIKADGSDYQGHEPRMAFDPDWSPDGRSLIFNAFAELSEGPSSFAGSRMRIFVLDRVTGAARRLQD